MPLENQLTKQNVQNINQNKFLNPIKPSFRSQNIYSPNVNIGGNNPQLNLPIQQVPQQLKNVFNF